MTDLFSLLNRARAHRRAHYSANEQSKDERERRRHRRLRRGVCIIVRAFQTGGWPMKSMAYRFSVRRWKSLKQRMQMGSPFLIRAGPSESAPVLKCSRQYPYYEMRPNEPLSAVRAGAYLHHLRLESEDPAKLADFYAAAMDMRVESLADESLLCRGPGRRVLFAKGRPKSLGFAAFACRDRQGLEELRERARTEGLEPAASPSPLFDDRAFSVRDPDGNVIVFGLAPQPAENEGAASRLHGPLQHLTLTTGDPEALENFYAGKLGFAVSDRVRNEKGEVNTCWTRSNH
jgi:catechol 2,3-dioxygenase-like lactoylglutathione lyase family enzyme